MLFPYKSIPPLETRRLHQWVTGMGGINHKELLTGPFPTSIPWFLDPCILPTGDPAPYNGCSLEYRLHIENGTPSSQVSSVRWCLSCAFNRQSIAQSSHQFLGSVMIGLGEFVVTQSHDGSTNQPKWMRAQAFGHYVSTGVVYVPRQLTSTGWIILTAWLVVLLHSGCSGVGINMHTKIFTLNPRFNESTYKCFLQTCEVPVFQSFSCQTPDRVIFPCPWVHVYSYLGHFYFHIR